MVDISDPDEADTLVPVVTSVVVPVELAPPFETDVDADVVFGWVVPDDAPPLSAPSLSDKLGAQAPTKTNERPPRVQIVRIIRIDSAKS